MTARLLVMISGAGSNAADLIRRLHSADSTVDAKVVAVGADRDAPGLEFARAAGISCFTVEPEPGESRESWGERLIGAIDAFDPDLVILSGFMRLVPRSVVQRYSPHLINTHPAFLPEFPGAHAVADAMAAGVSETGASIIVVDNGVDTGPIIAQQRVKVLPGDTEDTLHERIKTVERELLFDVVEKFSLGQLRLGGEEEPQS